MSKLDRKNFLSKISLSAVGLILLSSFPLNLFGQKSKKSFKNVKVKIHPHSVKRNK